MENEIYIANSVGDTLKTLPEETQNRIAALIDSLGGEGWKNSSVVAPDQSPGGGLRAARSGNLRLLFRYAPEQHAIIVAGLDTLHENELVAVA